MSCNRHTSSLKYYYLCELPLHFTYAKSRMRKYHTIYKLRQRGSSKYFIKKILQRFWMGKNQTRVIQQGISKTNWALHLIPYQKSLGMYKDKKGTQQPIISEVHDGETMYDTHLYDQHNRQEIRSFDTTQVVYTFFVPLV